MAGKLLQCKMLSDQKIGVHEPFEKLIHVEEEGSGKNSVKLWINCNQQAKTRRVETLVWVKLSQNS